MSCNKYTQNLTWIAHFNLISSPFRHLFSPNASVLWNLCIMRQYKSSHFHCSKTKCACEITWDFPRCSKVRPVFTWIFVKTLQFSSSKYFNGKVCKVDSTTVYSFFWQWHEKRSTLQWEHPLANRNNFYIEILLSIFRSNLILPQLFAEKPSIKIMHVHGCGCVYPATKTPCQHPKYFVQYQNFLASKFLEWIPSVGCVNFVCSTATPPLVVSLVWNESFKKKSGFHHHWRHWIQLPGMHLLFAQPFEQRIKKANEWMHEHKMHHEFESDKILECENVGTQQTQTFIDLNSDCSFELVFNCHKWWNWIPFCRPLRWELTYT